MKALPAALLATLLLAAPSGAATKTPPAYPGVLLDLLPGWIAEADEAGRDAQGRPVSEAAQEYLEKAREAAAQGRFRVALFDLETHHQLVESRRLLDEASAQGNLGRQKDLVLARGAAWRAEALEDWSAFRARLHALDAPLKSLHAAELALYGADLGLMAALQTAEVDALRTSILRDDGLPEGLVTGLARATRTVSYSLSLATDVLDAAAALEGLPPRMDEASWSATLAVALARPEGETPQHRAPLETLAGSARDRDEGLLALALQLASARHDRLADILFQFGDAQARGLDAVANATVGLRRGAENVTLAAPREAGLLGVFTADALDRAHHTLAFADQGLAALPTLAFAWASLDHQAQVTYLLSQAAPAPTPTRSEETPFPGLAGLAAACAAALVLARRR